MRKPVYLDYHATTPVDPRVVEAMTPYFTERFGNAASKNHAYGWDAKNAVGRARKQVAALIGANPREIVFTSGATESNNLALKGVAARRSSGRVLTCVTEHKAVLDPLGQLDGMEVVRLPVDGDGLLDLDVLSDAADEPTFLVSLMAANNEMGILHPLREIRDRLPDNVVFHVDAAQAVGRVAIDVDADGIDLLSISGHKIYAPKGVGALFVRRRGRRVELDAQMDGGGHERGLRSGTLNVPGIVALGAACDIARVEMDQEAERLAALRDRLHAGIRESLDDVRLNGAREPRLPNNLNLAFEGVDGESLLMGLDDLAVSSGSACTSEQPEPSHVLRAMGLPDRLAASSIRFGLGRWTTEEEVDYAARRVAEEVRCLRALS